MEELLEIGQWQGFFLYGREYGEMVEGQEVEFRLFVEEFKGGEFSGRVIDWEGLGANGEVAGIKGFLTEDFISFTKQYDTFYTIDEWGNTEIYQDVPGHKVVYEGKFDRELSSFAGTWEIAVELEHKPDYTIEELATGTWRMHKQP